MNLDISRRRLGAWVSLTLLLACALGLFGWSGSGGDPRVAALWTWSAGGWLVPAPGLGALWIAGAILFAVLSAMAWLLFNPIAGARTLKPWVVAGIVLGLAIGIRVFIVRRWTPLPLEAGALSGALPAGSGWRWVAVGGDLAVVVLLLLALAGAGRSLWWAVLFALHPLTLLEIAGNGHLIALAMAPLIFVVAVSHRFSRRLRMGIGAAVAGACVAAIVAAGRQSGFNSLTLELAWVARVPVMVALPLAAVVGQAVVLAMAWRRDWGLARVLVHVLMIFLIFSPAVQPWYVVPVLALIPLAWSRSGWVLSLTVLGAYMVMPIVRTHGHSGAGLRVPEWWLMFEWVAVIALEASELWAALRRRPLGSAAAASPRTPALDPAR